jgi:hypothetical protein
VSQRLLDPLAHHMHKPAGQEPIHSAYDFPRAADHDRSRNERDLKVRITFLQIGSLGTVRVPDV